MTTARSVEFPEPVPSTTKEKVFEVARRLDPILSAPFAAGYKVLNGITVARARRVPLYVALEREEQKVEGQGDGVGLTLEQFRIVMDLWEQRQQIEQHLSVAPRLERCLRTVAAERPATAVVRDVVFAWQRLTRGWDDRSLWSLDWHLCRTLGAQLTMLANTTHGWPGTDEFPEFEDWQAALRHHGEVLTAAANTDIADNFEDEQRRYADAEKSLHWVADHLGNLWD